MSDNTNQYRAIYPAQCKCGHLFLEKYRWEQPTDAGYIGFCWCGFCKNRVMVKPYTPEQEANPT